MMKEKQIIVSFCRKIVYYTYINITNFNESSLGFDCYSLPVNLITKGTDTLYHIKLH